MVKKRYPGLNIGPTRPINPEFEINVCFAGEPVDFSDAFFHKCPL